MRVDLPSLQADGTPNYVDLRDKLRPGDAFAVNSAAKITSGADGGTVYAPREMEDDRLNALLGRIITAWSYPVPIPSQNSFQAADVAIDGAMDLDDYAALKQAVQPLMEKIDGKGQDPKQPPTT
jgi:hypothetical protein